MWGGPEFLRFQRFAHTGQLLEPLCCTDSHVLGVRSMEFSPNEQFLMTHSLIRDREGAPAVQLKVKCALRITVAVNIMQVFNVRTGAMLRLFQGPLREFIVGKDGSEPSLIHSFVNCTHVVYAGPSDLTWPLFKWAGGCDDKYFAKLGTSKNQQAMISVYETPDMVDYPPAKQSIPSLCSRCSWTRNL